MNERRPISANYSLGKIPKYGLKLKVEIVFDVCGTIGDMMNNVLWQQELGTVCHLK